MDVNTKAEDAIGKWQELQTDLWSKHLPHLREELPGEGIYVFIDNFHNDYGFPEEEESEAEKSMEAYLIEAAGQHKEVDIGWSESPVEDVVVYGTNIVKYKRLESKMESGVHHSSEL